MAHLTKWFLTSAVCFGAVGCHGDMPTGETSPLRSEPLSPHFSEYPDSAAMIAAGVPFSGDISVTAAGQLLGDTAFRATGTLEFHWANDVQFSTTGRLLNGSGATVNTDTQSASWYRIGLPVYQGDTSLTITLSTSGNKCGLTGKANATGTAKTILNPGSLVVWQLTVPHSAPDRTQPACRVPAPKFAMSTNTQHSGQGGTLTLSAGHSVTLQSTTTDFGVPATTAGDLTWIFDQTQLGTGASHSFTPSYGTHTITLSLINSTGQGEASGTLVVVPPDEAGSCDDAMTDVVETDCDGNNNGSYGVGAGPVMTGGTQRCWVLDWYVWNETLGHHIYDHTETVACWYEE